MLSTRMYIWLPQRGTHISTSLGIPLKSVSSPRNSPQDVSAAQLFSAHRQPTLLRTRPARPIQTPVTGSHLPFHTTALPIVTSRPCDTTSSHLPNSAASFTSCDPQKFPHLDFAAIPRILHVIEATPHLPWRTTQFQRLGLGYCLFDIDYLIQFSHVKHIGV